MTTTRPCPTLKRHRSLDMAYVAFKVRGRRVWRYFGTWGTRSAKIKWGAFVLAWPDPLTTTTPTAGTWPARRMLTHDGRTQSAARWAAEVGVKATTIRYRLSLGWDVERALTTPARPLTLQRAA